MDSFNYSKGLDSNGSNRSDAEYEYTTRKGWQNEDHFLMSIAPYLSPEISIQKNGADKDRIFQKEKTHKKVNSLPDFLMKNSSTEEFYYFGFTVSETAISFLTPKESEHYQAIKKLGGGYVWRRDIYNDYVFVSFTDPQIDKFKKDRLPGLGYKLCRVLPSAYIKNNTFPDIKSLAFALEKQFKSPKPLQNYAKYKEDWIKDSIGMESWGWVIES